MKKLTRAQQEVVELLESNADYYVVRCQYYNHQKILSKTPFAPDGCQFETHTVDHFTRPTFDVLLRLNIIKPTDQKDIYVLSEKE